MSGGPFATDCYQVLGQKRPVNSETIDEPLSKEGAMAQYRQRRKNLPTIDGSPPNRENSCYLVEFGIGAKGGVRLGRSDVR